MAHAQWRHFPWLTVLELAVVVNRMSKVEIVWKILQAKKIVLQIFREKVQKIR